MQFAKHKLYFNVDSNRNRLKSNVKLLELAWIVLVSIFQMNASSITLILDHRSLHTGCSFEHVPKWDNERGSFSIIDSSVSDVIRVVECYCNHHYPFVQLRKCLKTSSYHKRRISIRFGLAWDTRPLFFSCILTLRLYRALSKNMKYELNNWHFLCHW